MSDSQSSRHLHWIVAHLEMMGLVVCATACDSVVRYTDRVRGLVDGLLQGVILAIPFGILMLPWSLLMVGLYRWTGWTRFRAFGILLPALFTFGTVIVGWISAPPGPPATFVRWAKMKLPEDATDLRYYYSGGGLGDYTIVFRFHSSPAQIQKLVSGLNLTGSGQLDAHEYELFFKSRPLVPDFKAWNGAVLFTQLGDSPGCEVLVNPDKTEIYIYFSTI